MVAVEAERTTPVSVRPERRLVLGYHAVSETWPAALSVTPDQLRGQLEWLLDRGYTGVLFHDVATSRASRRAFAITFDDAYRSVLELAWPILSDLGVPATVFAVTDFASDGRPLAWPGIDHWMGGPHAHELRGLAWNELAELAEGGWEVGSHTRRHPRLTQLDDDDLERELRESRTACEEALGRPCRALAYPYGDVDARVVRAAAQAGYAAAAIEGLARPHPLAWPRVGVYHGNSMRRFRLKASPTFAGLRTTFGRAERQRSRLLRATD
jgi:peptidoglycan/xylan/chitin deacetylase (PgdA/CDA1 family)